MKAFVSWSGGKDCMLALHRFLKNKDNEVSYLINMCENNSEHSRSHGIKKSLIKEQVCKIGIPIIQEKIDKSYEASLKKIIKQLKSKGITTGVFGDIYLEEHKTWIERVCAEMKIEAIFPLWGNNTSKLLKEFIEEGFKALTVSIRCDKLLVEWLGRELNTDFFKDIAKLEEIDPCAENGEYHSFVYDGPIFKSPVLFTKGEITTRDNHHFLELIEEKNNEEQF
jgi:uncharacterized protein (TIGR00290 family)